MRYVDNKNAPSVKFIRKNGRIIPIIGNKNIPSASSHVQSRISEMTTEVINAQQGRRGVGQNGKAFSTPSTFPKWYSEHRFANKNDFFKVAGDQKSVRNDRLVNQAIADLLNGYSSPSGRVPPNRQFQIATRQVFDNKNVIFRKIDGKIVPIRLRNNEVPF